MSSVWSTTKHFNFRNDVVLLEKIISAPLAILCFFWHNLAAKVFYKPLKYGLELGLWHNSDVMLTNSIRNWTLSKRRLIPLGRNTRPADVVREMARLHVEYESLDPWPLESAENKDVPYSERVTKMKLSVDRKSLKVNESLTLAGIPAETFEYRLGSRSALEWVIDQYQVKGESDPNRESDPGYIVRLVGQVVRVSIETARIVRDLPDYR